MTSGVMRTRNTPFFPVNAYRKICGNLRSISSLTRLISFASVTGAARPPTDSPRISSQLKEGSVTVSETLPLLLTCPPTFSQGKLESLADWM